LYRTNNIRSEFELYSGMVKWSDTYLKNKFKNKRCKVFVLDCHSIYLYSILDKYDVIQYYPQVLGLKIEIDVLGIVRWKDRAKIYLVETKKTALNLQNLGQLLIYFKLCNPEKVYFIILWWLG